MLKTMLENLEVNSFYAFQSVFFATIYNNMKPFHLIVLVRETYILYSIYIYIKFIF